MEKKLTRVYVCGLPVRNSFYCVANSNPLDVSSALVNQFAKG